MGDGPERANIEAEIDSRGLTEDVAIVGYQQNPYAYMARSSMFVFASHWEGFPNVLLEALACELPVVSTNCPAGPAEIIEHRVNGMLVPVAQPEMLAEAVLEVLEDTKLRENLATSGKRRAEDFCAPRIVGQYAASFRQIAGMEGR